LSPSVTNGAMKVIMYGVRLQNSIVKAGLNYGAM
jgi:hypothetical protein